jgi:phage-related protein
MYRCRTKGATPDVGPRCHEFRVVDENRTWRIVYRIDADAIIIAEVFGKTTRQTPGHVIETCRRRFRMYDAATRGD